MGMGPRMGMGPMGMMGGPMMGGFAPPLPEGPPPGMMGGGGGMKRGWGEGDAEAMKRARMMGM